MGYDPLSGHLFLFIERDRDKIKILHWDSAGYALWYKRLERGVFRVPSAKTAGVELKASELAMEIPISQSLIFPIIDRVPIGGNRP